MQLAAAPGQRATKPALAAWPHPSTALPRPLLSNAHTQLLAPLPPHSLNPLRIPPPQTHPPTHMLLTPPQDRYAMIEDLVVRPRTVEKHKIEKGEWNHPYQYEKVRGGGPRGRGCAARACVEWGVLTSSWSGAAELATRGGRGG